MADACRLVWGLLNTGDIVSFESTIYPGCKGEFCAPILEETSGLLFNKDFFCGYSPETYPEIGIILTIIFIPIKRKSC